MFLGAVSPVLCCLAQNTVSFDSRGMCGNPALESQGWVAYEGIAEAVVGHNSVRIRLAAGGPSAAVVRLPGISFKAGRAFEEFTRRSVAGQRVEVLLNPELTSEGRPLPRKLTAMVVLKDRGDLGLALIRAGVARYVEPPSYTLSGHLGCLYRVGERLAEVGTAPPVVAPEFSYPRSAQVQVVAEHRRVQGLRGTVRGRSGASVQRAALVELVSTEGEDERLDARLTDRDGCFNFGTWPEGVYYLKVSNSGFDTLYCTVYVGREGDNRPVFELRPSL